MAAEMASSSADADADADAAGDGDDADDVNDGGSESVSPKRAKLATLKSEEDVDASPQAAE